MTLFDGILILILGVSIFFAAYRGAVRELITLVCLGLAAFLAWILLNPVLGVIGKTDSFFAIIFVAAALGVVSFGILYFLATKLTGNLNLDSQQTLIDRVVGGAFGLIRALALVGLAFLGAGYFVDEENQPDAVRNALLLPVAKMSAGIIEGFAPTREPALPAPAPTGGREVGDDAPSRGETSSGETAPDATSSDETNAASTATGTPRQAAYGRETRNELNQLVTTVTTSASQDASALEALANADDPIAVLAHQQNTADNDADKSK